MFLSHVGLLRVLRVRFGTLLALRNNIQHTVPYVKYFYPPLTRISVGCLQMRY